MKLLLLLLIILIKSYIITSYKLSSIKSLNKKTISSSSSLFSRFIPTPISQEDILPKLKSTKTKLEILKFFNIDSVTYIFKELLQSINILWNFTRPHTIVGSAISVIALFLFATPPEFWLTKSFAMSLVESALPALLMNIYITGYYDFYI